MIIIYYDPDIDTVLYQHTYARNYNHKLLTAIDLTILLTIKSFLMNRLCLLLLCSIVLCKATGQPGSLDPTFGNNGIQTTAFYNNLNTSIEQGSKVLTNASGDIFVVVLVSYSSTRIAKYLPDGRLDSS